LKSQRLKAQKAQKQKLSLIAGRPTTEKKKPSELTLIEMKTLFLFFFLLVNQFHESHFVTLDYKKWFYPIPLAETLNM